MRKVASFYSYIGRPPTTHELGVQRLPGGRGPGGKGDFYFGSIEGPNSIQDSRRYPVNALNQYNIVVLTQKYSYPQALRIITKTIKNLRELSQSQEMFAP
jgi:hypothetical protein